MHKHYLAIRENTIVLLASFVRFVITYIAVLKSSVISRAETPILLHWSLSIIFIYRMSGRYFESISVIGSRDCTIISIKKVPIFVNDVVIVVDKAPDFYVDTHDHTKISRELIY